MYILAIAIWLLSPFLVYGDANRRPGTSALKWAVLVILFPVLGLLSYAVAARSKLAWGLLVASVAVGLLALAAR